MDSMIESQGDENSSNPDINTSQGIDSNHPSENFETDGNESVLVIGKRKRKTSTVWNDFHEIDLPDSGRKAAVCNYCKSKFSTGGSGSSTSHLRRHSLSCIQKKLLQSRHRQTIIPYQSSNVSLNPFFVPGTMFSNEKMREAIASAIMVHEYPFTFVEDKVLMWAIKLANPEFECVSRKTIKNDCMRIYEMEKKIIKTLLKSVNKISLTTDMWRSSHQVAEYMVITGHFIDSEWKLQKRILNFVKVPPPRRGIDVADAIFKCLQVWEIENKVFSISVDNASYNDVCVRNLKATLGISNNLVLGGKLFHVRCCAHILNLLVQQGLNEITSIIENVRESVKYVNMSDSRLKTFCDIVKQMQLKERKLIIDCPTRWNSTFEMLATALKFKDVFPGYKEREPHYNYLPSFEDWKKVDKVCHFLEIFSLATHVISGSYYPTANLYLPEVYRVKEVIDAAIEDSDDFMRQMAKPMKEKFDKYLRECNLLMAIASVLDPRCKFRVVNICFSLIYKSEFEKQVNVKKVEDALKELYDEYLTMSVEESSYNNEVDTNVNQFSSQTTKASTSGFDKLMSIVREEESLPPTKSDLESYLEDGLYVCDKSSDSFNVLEWWKNNSFKYKVLSKIAAEVLVVPISTVASESTFSASGRVIDSYRASLAEETVQALICGGDWLRNKYGLKRKEKDEPELNQIYLPL